MEGNAPLQPQRGLSAEAAGPRRCRPSCRESAFTSGLTIAWVKLLAPNGKRGKKARRGRRIEEHNVTVGT